MQVKIFLRICKNENFHRRGECGYNPGYNYDMIYYVMISNKNSINKKVEINKCGDETNLVQGGFGGGGCCLTVQITSKSGMTNYGKIIMITGWNHTNIH